MKKITVLFAVLLFCSAANAQYRHEITIGGGGGLSTMRYDLTAGKRKSGLGDAAGFTAGMGYTFFFSPKWGLGTGAELSLYNNAFNLDNLATRSTATDPEGAAFEFRSAISGYEEAQHALMAQLPLMLQFQTGNSHQFYAAVGGKVGIPVNGKYKNTAATLQNSGYYAQEDYEYTTQEFLGFGTFTGRKDKGGLQLKAAFTASAESGVKWRIREGLSLYTGAYLDYGLNNIRKENQPGSQAGTPFIAYNPASPPDFAINGMMHSQYTQSGATQSFTGKVIPMAAGLKLRLAFGRGSAVKSTAPAAATNNAVETRRRAEAEAARQQATSQTQERQQADAERIAKEQEAQRLAAERTAQTEAARLQEVKASVALPVENYTLSQTELTAAQQQELDKKIALLQQNPALRFHIYGHTCDIGGDEVNERVGLQRAEKAKEYLLSKGITASRILGVASKRDSEPLAPNTSEENRRMNRRAEIVIENAPM